MTQSALPDCAPLAGNSGAEARDIEAAIPLRAGQPWPQMRGPGRRMDPLTQRVKTPQAAHCTTGRGVARRLHKVSASASRCGRSYMRQSSPPASGLPRVHCVVHSGGDLHAIHTAVRVMLGAARTRTGDRRHALYRRRHTGHDMVEWRLHEAIAVYTLHARSPAPVRRDGLWRRTSTRPTAPSAAARPAPTCAVAAGRQGSRRGAPRVGTWWTRHRHVASALLCKARFTDLRFHRTDAFRVAEEDTGTHPPGWVPRKNQAFSDLPGSRGRVHRARGDLHKSPPGQ